MYLIYSLLLGLAFIILLPRFLIDALSHGKYVAGFRERLGSLTSADNTSPVIWVHCVSVGETQAALPLVKALAQSHRIVVSTVTKTGQELAQDIFRNTADKVFYFPFDWRWTARRALNKINPALVVIMETELWPGFLRECKVRSVPVVIVNGRLSARSFRRYRLIKGFMRRVLSSVSLAIMQTETDGERLERLGMPASKIKVIGNLKFDAGTVSNATVTQELRNRFQTNTTPVVLAASTHEPEERVILDAFKQICSEVPVPLRLMIAPRHPERFREVAQLIVSKALTIARRSDGNKPNDSTAQVILLDSIGELRYAYTLASIVFVGGSISRSGGHNILEPAAVAASIITGAHTHNFHQIIERFLAADAIVQLPPVSEAEASAVLSRAIIELLRDDARRRILGERAKLIVENNRGATERAIALITPLLNASTRQPAASDNLTVQGASTA